MSLPLHDDDAREASDAEVQGVMADAERALDALVGLFTKLRARDRSEGNPSDKPALGGVAMALNGLGRDELMLVASMAVRRAAEVVSDAR